MVLFGLFRFAFFCFGLIETQKLSVSVWNRNNRNKHFFSDSGETSFGSIFGCFESKLVSLDTLVTDHVRKYKIKVFKLNQVKIMKDIWISLKLLRVNYRAKKSMLS